MFRKNNLVNEHVSFSKMPQDLKFTSQAQESISQTEAPATISGIEKGCGEIIAKDSFQNSEEQITGTILPLDRVISTFPKPIPENDRSLMHSQVFTMNQTANQAAEIGQNIGR